jgi:membrane protein
VTSQQGRTLLPELWKQAVEYGRAAVGTLQAAWREYEHDYARFYAGAMVYHALVSLIPLLLLAVAGLGLVLRYSDWAADAQQQVLRAAELRFGADVRLTVEQLLGTLKQESIVTTVVSIVALLVTASGLFKQLRVSFRALWKVPPPVVSGSIWFVARTMIVEQAVSFAMVAAGGGLLLGALTLIAANQWLSEYFDRLPLVNTPLAWLLAQLSPLTIAFVTFALLFKYLPPSPLRWEHVLSPAALCAVAWVVAGELLALYGAFFGSNQSASSAIGGLLVIMLWMNMVSQLVFFGAELCKVLATGAAARIGGSGAQPPSS